MAGQDKDKNRDWDKELAEVDRLLAKLPAADATRAGGSAPTVQRPAAPPPVSASASGTGGVAISGREWLGTWARVVLGLLVGIGMMMWPYSYDCGLRLMFYLAGVLVVITAGGWSSISSWKRRLGFAHIVSQLLIVWGLVLGAAEVLPRIGYAKTPATWLCHK